jgi:glycosyltransferase involved in cell wall biosynthesis
MTPGPGAAPPAPNGGGLSVGVVIPAFNAAPFIADALGSLQRQTFAGWRAVVVDDGSTDATADIVAGFAGPRISLLRQANQGAAAARNHGVAAIDAEALLFLDADDWLAENALERLATALARAPEAVACSGPHLFVTSAARPGRPVAARAGGPAPSGRLLDRLLRGNLFTSGGHVLVRAGAFRAAGGYRPGLVFGEDYELWVRLALLGPFSAVPGVAPLLYVRRPPTGAFRSMAHDPSAIIPCLDAIFANPGVIAHLGPRLGPARVRAEAENAWIVGRELLRQGRLGEGRAALRRSLAMAPGLKRLLLAVAAQVWPGGVAAFRPYAD